MSFGLGEVSGGSGAGLAISFPRLKTTRLKLLTLCFASLCITGAVVGVRLLAAYENTPGTAGAPPRNWPVESKLAGPKDEPTLLMVVHPRCPCSAASLRELEQVLAHAAGKFVTRIIFATPPGAPRGWELGSLWEQAKAIPGVEVVRDDECEESRRFAAETSGHTLLFASDGRLLFSGGITGARGHSGDNAGRESLLALLNTTPGALSSTPVFGCPLSGPSR